MEILRVKRLHPAAKLPTKGDPGAIGLDLRACYSGLLSEWEIPPGGRAAIATGIAVAVPPDHYARIAPRSGLAFHHGVDVLAGVIDPTYTGEVLVILYNTGTTPFRVVHGDRVAQIVLEKASPAKVVEVAELEATERGANGFGSSGR